MITPLPTDCCSSPAITSLNLRSIFWIPVYNCKELHVRIARKKNCSVSSGLCSMYGALSTSFSEVCRMNASVSQEANNPHIMYPEGAAVCAFQNLSIVSLCIIPGVCSAQEWAVSPSALLSSSSEDQDVPSPHLSSLTVALMMEHRGKRLGTQLFKP